jgi:hypothetical protein
MVSKPAISGARQDVESIESRKIIAGSDNGCSLPVAESETLSGGDAPDRHIVQTGRIAPLVADPTPGRQGADPRPFIHHMFLAAAWCRWNGQKGTEKQTLRVMRQLTVSDLQRMLAARGVAVPEVAQ